MSGIRQMPFEDFAIMMLSKDNPLVESEWREELDAAELSDEEREAAARALRRMESPDLTVSSIRSAIKAMSNAAVAATPAFQAFSVASQKLGRAMATTLNGVVRGAIQGQRFDVAIMDDHVNWPAHWPHDRLRDAADRLDALDWYHAAIHPKHYSNLSLPAPKPVFPPKVAGETVVPQLARVCVDPQETHVGPPIWPYGHAAPLPPDRMPRPGTPTGHPRRAAQPPPRRTLGHSGRGRTRKQRR